MKSQRHCQPHSKTQISENISWRLGKNPSYTELVGQSANLEIPFEAVLVSNKTSDDDDFSDGFQSLGFCDHKKIKNLCFYPHPIYAGTSPIDFGEHFSDAKQGEFL